MTQNNESLNKWTEWKLSVVGRMELFPNTLSFSKKKSTTSRRPVTSALVNRFWRPVPTGAISYREPETVTVFNSSLRRVQSFWATKTSASWEAMGRDGYWLPCRRFVVWDIQTYILYIIYILILYTSFDIIYRWYFDNTVVWCKMSNQYLWQWEIWRTREVLLNYASHNIRIWTIVEYASEHGVFLFLCKIYTEIQWSWVFHWIFFSSVGKYWFWVLSFFCKFGWWICHET